MDLETLKGTVVQEEFSRVHTQIFLFEMFSL